MSTSSSSLSPIRSSAVNSTMVLSKIEQKMLNTGKKPAKKAVEFPAKNLLKITKANYVALQGTDNVRRYQRRGSQVPSMLFNSASLKWKDNELDESLSVLLDKVTNL